MEENNNIFLAGGDALLYLAEPMHKKVFVWGHPLSTYLSYDFFNSLPLWAPAYILDDAHPPPSPSPPPFPYVRTHLIDGPFLNQKTNKNIRISYWLKYKHSKKIIYEKKI